ncbi:G-protein coupled receptor GRL101-like [Littorina saxatilis]|uniref:G-protein coupled receptor GRL101-like n=1 Tax=Littorina saxatilis TaxID=31220 RepID=UPI0038B5319C
MVRCPQGHVTRKFLSCDQESQCGAKGVMTSCQVETREVAMFVCDDGRHSLPYSLVCDHIPNCLDKSDEDFCHHTPCPRTRFQCQSGQCVSPNVECNVKLDCFDGSEEMMCQYKLRTSYHDDTFSVIVELHGDGSYQTGYPPERCPPTHFPCLDGDFLPVFLRCNGIADCNSREDEENCESYACPGYYRCRNSSVCLHPHHMCDGIFHCPHFDDELLCKELTCPEACECQGLAFVCAANNFSVSAFPELRYLDVSGTAMSPGSLSNNLKLVRVSLSDTGLTVPPTLALPNLIHLDLSYNEIASVNLQAFGFLTNLRVLVLRGNPLFTFVSEALLESDIQRLQNALLSYGLVKSTDSLALRELDVSQTQIEVYNGSEFAVVPLLKHLNLSHTKLHTITDEGFKSTSKLELLDARASPVKIFPSDLLRVLADLHTVYADNFKLCCPAMLPEDFDIQNCYAAQDVLASCDALLRSNTYRVFLWIFAALSIAGNAGSFVTRLYLTKRATGLGSFEVFVTNLCVADFLMGVYLTIIGAADLKYQGEYLWFDDQWKESIACSFAGYLCLLSSEVSAFIICLITLDRFIVLHYPFSRFRFRRRSALLGCSFVWSAGIVLASVPLLPSTSHWRFYSQTGICIPLPFTTDMQFRGRVYSISVMIAVNFALFLLIAVGQVGIYWSVRHNSIASSSRNTTSRDAALARRLTSVVVSDFLCWFPIGLLGLLNYTGTPIPGEVNVGVAIFVLPLNSALNPFLYTFNVLMEKYRRAMRQYNSSSTKEAVLDQLKVCLASKTISITDIISAFINEGTSQMEIDVAVRSLLSNKNTARHKQLSH